MNKNLLGYYTGSKTTIHDRTYTRAKTENKNKRKVALAKNLNLLTNNNKHNAKLAKNG